MYSRRRLYVEPLESRQLLAQVSGITHTFREDDFSINGSFTYQQHVPDQSDYIDTVSNGRYTSSSGHVKWTSPTSGTGFFAGTATGDGRDTVDVGGRRNCSEYGIEEKGRMDFSLDAQNSKLSMTSVSSDSIRYTYYRDLTGGRCPQPTPQWARFFGGSVQNFAGTFNPATHKVTVRYTEVSPAINVDAPSTDLTWASSAATDFSLVAVPTPGAAPQVPNDFTGIPQSTQPPAVLPFVDVQSGGVDITVNVSGKPAKTSTPQTPVATIQAFWASSDTDTGGAEIPLTASSGTAGLFWNSAKLQASIRQLPVPPATARFIRITVNGTDADPSNSTRFLRIGDFQARSSTGAPVNEDTAYNGSADSVLHPLDRTDPTIRVFAYQPKSTWGANVQVTNDLGAFSYDATFLAAVQALGIGESMEDTVRFIAVKSQTLLSEATLTISLQGQNDLPTAREDSFTTTSRQSITILPIHLTNNDSDPDRNDTVKLKSVAATSEMGAEIRVVLNEAQTDIVEVVYDPTKSTSLRTLRPGQSGLDRFSYEIVDRNGGVASGSATVLVQPEEQFLEILPVANQYTTSGVATDFIPIRLETPDGDVSNVQMTGVADDTNLVPSGGVEILKENGQFSLRITPAPTGTGRTTITLTATNSAVTTTKKVRLVVGTETDLDLDGVPNQEEDSAPQSGDMNQDGIADSRQAHVASLRAKAENSFVNLSTPEDHFLANASIADSPTAAGPAAGSQLPLGLVQFDVLTQSETSSTVTVRTSGAELPLNRVFQFNDPQGWTSLMHDKQFGARVFADRFLISLRDGGRGDVNTVVDSQIHATIALGHVLHPWQNIVREDIDNDGFVVPLDALQLVNQLNNFGARALGSLPTGNQSLPNFLDPSGSDSLEPIDVLIVVNFLNNRALAAEGERTELVSGRALPPGIATQPAGSPVAGAIPLVSGDTERESRPRPARRPLAIMPTMSQVHPQRESRNQVREPIRLRSSDFSWTADVDAVLGQGVGFDDLI